MIAWSGKGWIVALINAACAIAGVGLAMGLNRSPETIEGAAIIFGLWGLVGGPTVWFAARHFERDGTRVLVDAQTGERHEVGGAGTFFFMPTRWWAFLNPAFAVLFIWLVWAGYWQPFAT